MRPTALLIPFALLACGGDDAGDSHTGQSMTTTPTTGTAGTTPTTPTTTSVLGELKRTGAANVDGRYAGTETWTFVGDEGYGDVICEVSYDVNSTAERSDCPGCLWAWDLQITNVTTPVDVDGACAAVGLDTAATLAGTEVSYGYDPVYDGHAQILMFFNGTDWQAGTYAQWDDTKKTFNYTWLDGLHAY